MMHNEFVSSLNKRRRYRARSLVGWKYFDERNPNYVHESLSLLEREGYVSGIVTQNVDRLHHRAGSKNVVELHGRNDVVRCLSCHADESRTRYRKSFEFEQGLGFQSHAFASDPDNVDISTVRADGDANVEDKDLNTFQVPGCSRCEQVVIACRFLRRFDRETRQGQSLKYYRRGRQAVDSGFELSRIFCVPSSTGCF